LSRARALALLMLGGACHLPAPRVIELPRAEGPIVADGNLEEPSWPRAFRSAPFEDEQGGTTPHTELRATADDEALYLLIYVADDDLQSSGDRVRLEVGDLRFEFTPSQTVAPAGVQVGRDLDGTLDNPKDDDEEWITEIALPWALLRATEPAIRVVRTDVGRGHAPRTLVWPRRERAVLRFARRS
jgi:hypothetical protein